MRHCVSAGETLPRHLFLNWRDRFGVEILDGIGSTEILHIFISNRPGRARPGSTGEIVPGFEARIVDDDGHDLPVGEVGTLLIKGDSIAAGYWNKHETTKQTFCGEWINTYDKFMLDYDGYFWYSGRANDMLKVSGQAVWPTEVEAVLQGHPAVLESGVTGAATDEGLLKPVAFVVLKDGREPSPELACELQQFVKNNAAPHKYPRAVVFVEQLPKTATGKIKRFELRHRAAQDGLLPRQRAVAEVDFGSPGPNPMNSLAASIRLSRIDFEDRLDFGRPSDTSQGHLNLLFDHGTVLAPFGHKLCVSSCLADAATFDDDNRIRPGNGAQSMGDHEARASAHQNCQTLLNQLFAFCVKVARGFVENEQFWICEDGAGDR